eukprot:Rmarinus@m.27913
MKFGDYLVDNQVQAWKFHYLDYSRLKNYLRVQGSGGRKWSSDDESQFVKMLDEELEKITGFSSLKRREVERRVAYCEDLLKRIQRTPKDDLKLQTLEEQLDEDTSSAIQEIVLLEKFNRLNYTAFCKILKKHDKYTPFMMKPLYMSRLERMPFYKFDPESSIERLSSVKNHNILANKKSTAGAGGAQNFVRQTTKYWVHPENVTALKCYIMRFLPVYVFKSAASKEHDPTISSVYYDNDNLELYDGRLMKNEGALAVRMRWYGDLENTEIFVERKTHHESWVGANSVKERFVLKEKYLNAFCAGDFTMEEKIKKMREKKLKSEEELENLETLSSEIQHAILDMKLRPMVRTVYRRTAFQLPGDASVRISLDTDLCMVLEDQKTGGNWRRMTRPDFSDVPRNEICRFPYAVLEVKLQTQQGQEAPYWVSRMLASGIAEPVPKFSKFVHGTAVLLESRVSALPFWLPQMEKDIRAGRRVREFLEEEELECGSSYSSSRLPHVSQRSGPLPLEQQMKRVVEVPTDDEDDEETSLLKRRRGSLPRERPLREDEPRLGVFGSLFGGGKKSILTHGAYDGGGRKESKPVAVAIRIEPKVFFANERTFLSWLSISITLAFLGISLLNFGENYAKMCGFIFVPISIMFMVYSLYMFYWRAHRIELRDAGPYNDKVGPLILVCVLVCAMVINFVLSAMDIELDD